MTVVVMMVVVVVVVMVVMMVMMVDRLVNVHGFLDVHGLLYVHGHLVHVVRYVDYMMFAVYKQRDRAQLIGWYPKPIATERNVQAIVGPSQRVDSNLAGSNTNARARK